MSLESVVGIMKQFVADIGGASTHPGPLPKMRKTIHDLAHASNLSNKRKRSGASRFTTLRTTLSSVNVDKKAIAQILGQTSSYVTHEGGKGEGRPRAGMIWPSGGEVVGEVWFFWGTDAICHGMGRRWQDWIFQGAGSAVGGRHQNNNVRPQCEQLVYILYKVL